MAMAEMPYRSALPTAVMGNTATPRATTTVKMRVRRSRPERSMSDNVCNGLGTAGAGRDPCLVRQEPHHCARRQSAGGKGESGDTRGSCTGQHRDEARADGAGDAVRPTSHA